MANQNLISPELLKLLLQTPEQTIQNSPFADFLTGTMTAAPSVAASAQPSEGAAPAVVPGAQARDQQGLIDKINSFLGMPQLPPTEVPADLAATMSPAEKKRIEGPSGEEKWSQLLTALGMLATVFAPAVGLPLMQIAGDLGAGGRSSRMARLNISGGQAHRDVAKRQVEAQELSAYADLLRGQAAGTQATRMPKGPNFEEIAAPYLKAMFQKDPMQAWQLLGAIRQAGNPMAPMLETDIMSLIKRLMAGEGTPKPPKVATLPKALVGVSGSKGKDRYTDEKGGVWDWNYEAKRWEAK